MGSQKDDIAAATAKRREKVKSFMLNIVKPALLQAAERLRLEGSKEVTRKGLKDLVVEVEAEEPNAMAIVERKTSKEDHVTEIDITVRDGNLLFKRISNEEFGNLTTKRFLGSNESAWEKMEQDEVFSEIVEGYRNAKKEERYVFYRFSRGDLECAIQSLDLIPQAENKKVEGALFRDAVIVYCRPFTDNSGIDGVHGMRIPERLVPHSKRKFHADIYKLRNKLFAHTPLDFRGAIALDLTMNRFPISSKGFYHDVLVKDANSLRILAKEVLEGLMVMMRKMEDGFCISSS